MFHIILYRPEIPPNTGNVIRLCANTGAQLHLIEPMAFTLDHAKLRRAGLDYHEFASVKTYASLMQCRQSLGNPRVFAIETGSPIRHDQVRYRPGDALLFGQETAGLPADVLTELGSDQIVSLPMRKGQRSLNLSNAVAVCVYEAWRQCQFL